MSSSRRIYTVEFKQEAVRMVTHQGLSRAEVASRLGIGKDLLRKWQRALEKGPGKAQGIDSRQPTAAEAELHQLREEVRRLTMERDILKKATVFFARESR